MVQKMVLDHISVAESEAFYLNKTKNISFTYAVSKQTDSDTKL